jgi:AraC-like DNA-binding protein
MAVSRDCPLHTILAIVGFAANAGVPPPELLRAAGLSAAALADPDAYVPHTQEVRLWDEAARLTGDQDFGVHLAEWVARSPPDHFDVLTFALRSCPTLGESYRLAGRYIRLLHEGVYLSLEEEGERARLTHGHIPEQIGPRHPVEAMLALAVLHGRLGIGDDLAPRAVYFMHPAPARVSEQERVFRAPVHYSRPRNELVLDRALLDRPQRHAEQRLLALLDRQLGALLSGLPESRRFKDRVARCMLDELPEREPSVATVAAKLHMSARSLQRRLQGEGTSFAEVLSDLRRDRALHYLQDPRISIGEVAFLLGFLDVTAFHRAFRRWTGSTPSEHRRSAASRRSSRPDPAGEPPG